LEDERRPHRGVKPAALDHTGAPRVDTGKTLAEHLRACGGDPDRLRSGEPYLN
jgi:hypothetical protein